MGGGDEVTDNTLLLIYLFVVVVFFMVVFALAIDKQVVKEEQAAILEVSVADITNIPHSVPMTKVPHFPIVLEPGDTYIPPSYKEYTRKPPREYYNGNMPRKPVGSSRSRSIASRSVVPQMLLLHAACF